MWISARLKECLSSNAQGDRIFRAEGDGDRLFCARLGTNAGEIVSKETKSGAQRKRALADRNRRREEDSLVGKRKQKRRAEAKGEVKRERRRLTRRSFGCKTGLRLWGKLGRSGMTGEVRERSDGEEGDLQRRRRRGESIGTSYRL